MGEIKFMGGLLMITVFVIAVMSYSIGYTTDNGAVVQIDSDLQLAGLKNNVSSNIDTFYVDTSNASEGFFKSTIQGADQTTVTGGEFKLGIGGMIKTTKNVFDMVNKNLFGGSQAFGYILTAFSTFLTYMGFRYIWKTWKGGNPD